MSSNASPAIVTPEEWEKARLELLVEEKKLSKQRAEVTAKRQAMPWVDITDKNYTFHDLDGENKTISQLFDLHGHDELVVYHVMFGESSESVCHMCAFFVDQFAGSLVHIKQRVGFAIIASADHAKMKSVLVDNKETKKEGWENLPLYSSKGSQFGFDMDVQYKPDSTVPTRKYNYTSTFAWGLDAPGFSVFKRQDGRVYHTYSTFSAGIADLSLMHTVLDLTPTGRDEGGEGKSNMWWAKHKEKY
eukprot:m.80838 g.80838  ORF g.80838 m.80838 type:complete len:246 (-) comp25354_c2_seq1:234-971(-)